MSRGAAAAPALVFVLGLAAAGGPAPHESPTRTDLVVLGDVIVGVGQRDVSGSRSVGLLVAGELAGDQGGAE